MTPLRGFHILVTFTTYIDTFKNDFALLLAHITIYPLNLHLSLFWGIFTSAKNLAD